MSPLTVTMLGGFTLTYEGKKVDLLANRRTFPIALQFLLLTWLRGEEGLTEDEAVLYFVASRQSADVGSALNYLTTVARRILKDSGLPPMRYVLRKGGAFYPDPNVLIDLDVNAFRDCVEQARGAADKADGRYIATRRHTAPAEMAGPPVSGRESGERFVMTTPPDSAGWEPARELACRKAIDTYRGRLLPELQEEEWVQLEGRTLADMYREVVDLLAQLTRDRGDAAGESALYERAAFVQPEQHWEARQLEALLMQGRDREAAQLYERTITRFLQGMKNVRTGRILAGAAAANGQILAFAKQTDEIFQRVLAAREHQGRSDA